LNSLSIRVLFMTLREYSTRDTGASRNTSRICGFAWENNGDVYDFMIYFS